MTNIKSRSLGPVIATGLLGVLVSLPTGVLRLEETVGLDWLFLLRGPQAGPTEVAVVAIDSDSAAALDLHPDPARWPRDLHAELITRLAAAGAAVIAFDLSFDAPREQAQDAALVEAVARAGNVILLERLDTDTIDLGGGAAPMQKEARISPIEPLARAALATAPFPLPRVPIKLSQFWVFGRAADDVPTLPAVAVHAYARDVHEELFARLAIARPDADALLRGYRNSAPGAFTRTMTDLRTVFRNDPTLARDLLVDLQATAAPLTAVTATDWRALLAALIEMLGGPDSRYLDYYGAARAIETLPYHEVVGEHWDPAAAGLDGRAVFVGFSEPSALEQQDEFYSPFSEDTGTSLSGVEIGATAFANLVRMRSVRPLSIPAHLALVFVWGLSVAALLLWLPVWAGLLTAALAAPIYLGVAYLQFDALGLWLPLVVPLLIQLPAAALLAVTARYAEAKAHGEQIGRTLSRYLPSWVTEDAARRTDGVGASTRVLYGTCLVTDADRYTSLSERLSPEALHGLLNDYYAVLFKEVERHGGFVADVVGDSMVAVWTSPTPDPAGHAAACRAASDILSAVEAFNAAADRPLPTRIGLHAGEVLLGDVGAQSHFEYRAVGDIVNTATRLEELNKQLGTRAIVSATALRGTAQFAVRPLGTFVLAGKGTPLVVNELLGLEDSLAHVADLVARFASGLAAFVAQDWVRAERGFEDLLERYPDDGPSRFYLERCRALMAAAPEPGWDGTISMAEK